MCWEDGILHRSPANEHPLVGRYQESADATAAFRERLPREDSHGLSNSRFFGRTRAPLSTRRFGGRILWERVKMEREERRWQSLLMVVETWRELPRPPRRSGADVMTQPALPSPDTARKHPLRASLQHSTVRSATRPPSLFQNDLCLVPHIRWRLSIKRQDTSAVVEKHISHETSRANVKLIKSV